MTESTSDASATTTSPCPHPEAVGKRWGDPISERRQAKLQGYLDKWAAETDHGERRGPFDGGPGELIYRMSGGVSLTGADVYWLVKESRQRADGEVLKVHLEGANLKGAHLEKAVLGKRDLMEPNMEARLEAANLIGAHLEGAYLYKAHLEGAFIEGAHLEGTILLDAHLEKADLAKAHLEGAKLGDAHLEGADLRDATLDKHTILENVTLASQKYGSAKVGGIDWGGAELSGVRWRSFKRVGDEHIIDDEEGIVYRLSMKLFADYYQDGVRAYRRLAIALRDQGMTEEADYYTYRAKVWQRRVLLRELRLPAYLGSWVLALLAGYGYRPGRSLFWYLAVIVGFTLGYMQATHGLLTFGLPPSQLQPLPWYEALVLSVSSFHGRGFFQPLQSLGDPVAILAAIEAVVGLLIEITFIATFTQRFFAR